MMKLPVRPADSEERKDQGFTLIELLVVVLIIGVLAAIAIPVFLSQREKADEAGVKSDLKNAATLMETYYVDKQAYPAAGAITPLQAAGYDLKTTNGNILKIVTLSTSKGFCLSGNTKDGTKMFYYDSTTGGLATGETKPAGCA